MLVHCGISRIFKLLGNIDPWIFLRHPYCCLKTLIHACSYISGIMDQYHLCSVVLYKESSLLTYTVRHNDPGLISHDGADKCKSDALISAGGLYDYGIILDTSVLKRLFYHIVCGTGLDGTAHIKSLVLYENLCRIGIVHPSESYDRSVSDIFKYIIAYHMIILFSCSAYPGILRKFRIYLYTYRKLSAHARIIITHCTLKSTDKPCFSALEVMV